MKLVIAICSKRPEMWNNVFQNITKQYRTPDGVVFTYHKTGKKTADALMHDLGDSLKRPIAYFRMPDHLSLPAMYYKAYDEAAIMAGRGGLICTMDDDDNYGQGYLSEVEETFEAHPDATLIGKSWYRVHYADEPSYEDEYDGRKDYESDGKAVSVAGPTMCLPASLWLDNNGYRLSPECAWADVDIQERARSMGSIYSMGWANFTLIRYKNPYHGHGWNRPDPKG